MKKIHNWLFAAIFMLLVACAGGSPVTSISITPSESTLVSGASTLVIADVDIANGVTPNVNWTTTAGSLSSTKGMAIRFTAPAVTTSTQVTITGVSAQDNTKIATTVITVNPPPIAVTVAPIAAITAGGTTAGLQAKINGTNVTAGQVTWSIVGGVGTLSSATALNPTFSSNTPGSALIRATSTSDTSKFGETTIIVNAAALSVTVDPIAAITAGGTSLALNAKINTFNATAGQVTWSIIGGVGTLSSTTALNPTFTSNTPGTALIRATSTLDTSKYGEATITVNSAALVVAVDAITGITTGGTTAPLQATINGTNATAGQVTWSIISGTGSLVTSGGGCTALKPCVTSSVAGTARVRATSTVDTSKFGEQDVVITGSLVNSVAFSAPSPAPSALGVASGGTISNLTATITGSTTPKFSPNLTWSIVSGGGTLSTASTTGVDVPTSATAAVSYTAPVGPDTVVIRAQSVQDPSKFAEITINVNSPASSISTVGIISPANNSDLNSGASINVTAAITGTGTFSPNMTWSVTGPGLLGSFGATSTTTTPATVFYTAPVVSSDTTVTLTATSDQDNTKFSSITLNIKAPKTYSVASVTPSATSFTAGSAGVTLTAVINQANPTAVVSSNVRWSIISGVGTLSPTQGNAVTTLTSDTVGSVVVRATSIDDPSKFKDSTVIEVTSAPASAVNSIAFSAPSPAPAALTVASGGTISNLTATISGSTTPTFSPSMIWTIDSGGGSLNTYTTIGANVATSGTGSVNFTAPTGPATVVVRARSVQDSSVTSTITINVSAPSVAITDVVVSPSATSFIAGSSGVSISAVVNGTGATQTVTWSRVGGTVPAANVTFTTSSSNPTTLTSTTTGTILVRATSTQDSSKFTDVAITVNPVNTTFAISASKTSPASGNPLTGAIATLTADVTSSPVASVADDAQVVWSIISNPIGANLISPTTGATVGVTAQQVGTVRVRATSQQDPSKVADIDVTFETDVTVKSTDISASPASPTVGQSTTLTAILSSVGSAYIDPQAVEWSIESSSTGAGTLSATTGKSVVLNTTGTGIIVVKAKSRQNTADAGNTISITVNAANFVTAVVFTGPSPAPAPVSVTTGSTITLTALITGSSSPAFSPNMTWSIRNSGAGSLGTTATTTATASSVYTAPSSPTTVVVRATSNQDSTKYADITVNVLAPNSTVTGVAFSAPSPVQTPPTSSADVAFGSTVNLSAAVSGTNSPLLNLTWSIISGGGTLNAYTTTTATGTVTLTPPVVSSDTPIRIRATSVQDTSKFAEIVVTAKAPADNSVTSVVFTAATLTAVGTPIASGGTISLIADINGNGSFSPNLTWSIVSGGGSLNVSNTTANPASVTLTAPTGPATVVVRARSVQDSSKFKDISVSVNAASAISVAITQTPVTTPNAWEFEAGSLAGTTLTVTVTNGTAGAVTWSIVSGVGTLTNSSGTTTKLTSNTAGTIVVRARSTQDTTKYDDKTVTVTAAPLVVTVDAAGPFTVGATPISLTANINSTPVTTTGKVTWSIVSGVGTLSSTTAANPTFSSSTSGSAVVRATSTVDTTKYGETTITVNAAAAISVSVSPSTASFVSGSAGQLLTATVTNGTAGAVTWSIASGVGTLSASSGASSTLTSNTDGTVVVRARSTQDTTKYADATITVNAAVTGLSLAVTAGTPTATPPLTMLTSGSRTITATLTGPGAVATKVLWSIVSGSGNLSSISGSAATTLTSSAAGVVKVRATSEQNTAVYAEMNITVVSISTVAITTPATTLAVDPITGSFAAIPMTSSVTGSGAISQADVTWSSNAGGTFSSTTGQNVSYTPPYPAPNGSITITATSTLDPTKSGTRLIEATRVDTPMTVSSSVSGNLQIAGVTPTLPTSTLLTANLTGNSFLNTGQVSWTVTTGAGTLSSSTGNSVGFTATTAGSVVVTATSQQDNSVVATYSVNVVQINSVGLTGTSSVTTTPGTTIRVNPGTAASLNAVVNGTGATQTVTWSASSGAVTGSGASVTYDPPTPGGTYTVTATSTQDTGRNATVNIEAVEVTTFLTPTAVASTIQKFLSGSTGTPSYPANTTVSIGSIGGSFISTTPVIWTIEPSSTSICEFSGSLTNTGEVGNGVTPTVVAKAGGTCKVRATSSQDSSKTALVPDITVIEVTAIAPITSTSTFVRVGLTNTLGGATVTTNGSTTKIWESSDTTKCTVNALTGVVTGVARGTCNITAKSAQDESVMTAPVTITVWDVTSVSISAGSNPTTIVVGGAVNSTTLTATINPTGSPRPPLDTVTWSVDPTSDPNACGSVSGGVVTAGTAGGNCVVRATSDDDTSVHNTFIVNVRKYTTVSMTGPASATLGGNSAAITASCNYVDGTGSGSDTNITWSVTAATIPVTSPTFFGLSASTGATTTITTILPGAVTGNYTAKATCDNNTSIFGIWTVNFTP